MAHFNSDFTQSLLWPNFIFVLIKLIAAAESGARTHTRGRRCQAEGCVEIPLLPSLPSISTRQNWFRGRQAWNKFRFALLECRLSLRGILIQSLKQKFKPRNYSWQSEHFSYPRKDADKEENTLERACTCVDHGLPNSVALLYSQPCLPHPPSRPSLKTEANLQALLWCRALA